MNKVRNRIFVWLLPLLLAACANNTPVSPLLRAEPDVDASLTRAPRTLRLYFAALPDVELSSVTLSGPGGELPLRGLHTMAADDLMIEIMEPLTPGSYVVNWRTSVAGDPQRYEGSYRFSVQAP